jgi:hypothetical protein
MDELNTITNGLNTLLASYTEPCIGDCDHSQCPLLRELHALRIKATLEKARLTVKPIVDRERQGEQIGDLMNMRLDSAAPRATGETTVEAALAELREVFPNNFIRVRTVIERVCDEKEGEEFDREHRAWVLVMNHGEFHGPTLADCMAQVRAAAQTKAGIGATRTEGEGEK